MAKEENGDQFLRMKGIAALLGISRWTLREIVKTDPSFPRFIELSPGVRMVRARAVREWVRRKELIELERGAPGGEPLTK